MTENQAIGALAVIGVVALGIYAVSEWYFAPVCESGACDFLSPLMNRRSSRDDVDGQDIAFYLAASFVAIVAGGIAVRAKIDRRLAAGATVGFAVSFMLIGELLRRI